VSATVSVKLSQFGLDFSEEACLNNIVAVAKRAASLGSRVEVGGVGPDRLAILNKNAFGRDSQARWTLQGCAIRQGFGSLADAESLCHSLAPAGATALRDIESFKPRSNRSGRIGGMTTLMKSRT
jgi:hypothetical protein